MYGSDVVGWTVEVELLAQIKTQLQWANWQRAGNRNAQKPKSDPRPGRRTETAAKAPLPTVDVRAYLDSFSYRPDEEVSTNGS